MIGYLFLSIALATGAIKGYCAKKTSGFTDTTRSAVFANLVRMLLCIVTGCIIVFASGDAKFLAVDGVSLAYCALSGVSTAIFVVTWLISVRSGAYMMVDTSLAFGLIIPIGLSVLFFGEAVKPTQLVGFLAKMLCKKNAGRACKRF